MVAASALFVISAIGSGLATGPVSLTFWRVVGGIGVGAASVIAPAYIAEISPASIRGRLGSLQQLAIVVGMIVLERYGRRRQRYAHGRRMRPIAPRRLTGTAAFGAAVLGWLPVLLGFGAPAAYLAVETAEATAETDFSYTIDPVPTTVTTTIVDISTGGVVASFAGHSTAW